MRYKKACFLHFMKVIEGRLLFDVFKQKGAYQSDFCRLF